VLDANRQSKVSRRSRVDRLFALGVFAVALVVLLGTSAQFGMAWDEGHTVRREQILADWFAWIVDPPPGHHRAEVFDQQALAVYWKFSREEPDGHPPFYALLGLAGWIAVESVFSPLTAYRFGPMSLAAVTAAALYHHLAVRRGRLAGFTAAFCFLLTPRPFAHAHYAHYDMPMTCLWLLTQIAFLNGLGLVLGAVAFGIALGLAAGTKFTGVFAVLPSLLWVLGTEGGSIARFLGGQRISSYPGIKTLLIGLPVAAITLYAIQPAWWSEPLRGPLRYFASNTTRAQSLPIPTLYLGRIYGFSLPWHNTIVLTAVTVPVFVLALALAGLVACWVRRRVDSWAMIWVLSWATLMVVRALPSAPGHDGVRLFLPSIASLGVLAGLGAAWLRDLLRPLRLAWAALALTVLAFGESIVGLVQTYPYTDSYYNATIGGLRGAERIGFELTYYWETMGPEFLAWLNSESREKPIDLRFPTPVVISVFMREWGLLPRKTKIDSIDPVNAPLYLMQRRRGVYLPHDWWLDRYGRPLFVVGRQGVDLMRVYADAEFQRARVATVGIPVPEYIANHFRGGHLHYQPPGLSTSPSATESKPLSTGPGRP
jgi:hypothetical protein